MARRSLSRSRREKPERGFFEQVGRAVVGLFVLVVLLAVAGLALGDPDDAPSPSEGRSVGEARLPPSVSAVEYEWNSTQSADPELAGYLDEQAEAIQRRDREAYIGAFVRDHDRRLELWHMFEAEHRDEDLGALWRPTPKAEPLLRAEAALEYEQQVAVLDRE